MIKLSSLKRNKRIVKSDHHVCIHLTISPRNESSVSGLRARRKRRFHGWLRRIETMSLGSSRRFNGGQIEREGKRERERKKEDVTFRVFLDGGDSVLLTFARSKRARIHRRWFTLFVAVTLALEEAAEDWQRSPLRCDAPFSPLHSSSRGATWRTTTPSNLYLAYTSTGRQKAIWTGDDSQNIRDPAPASRERSSFPAALSFSLPRNRSPTRGRDVMKYKNKTEGIYRM